MNAARSSLNPVRQNPQAVDRRGNLLFFIIARKMVLPGIGALDGLLGSAALAGLIILRFYYLGGKSK